MADPTPLALKAAKKLRELAAHLEAGGEAPGCFYSMPVDCYDPVGDACDTPERAREEAAERLDDSAEYAQLDGWPYGIEQCGWGVSVMVEVATEGESTPAPEGSGFDWYCTYELKDAAHPWGADDKPEKKGSE